MFNYFYQFDIFISYVVEDREMVEQIVESLQSKGFRVWYARKELSGGSDIYSRINEGLEDSRYGVALVSPSYKSNWAFREFFTLLQRKKRLIPVLHNISLEEIIADHPLIAPDISPIFALRAETGVEEVSASIGKVVQKKEFYIMHWEKY